MNRGIFWFIVVTSVFQAPLLVGMKKRAKFPRTDHSLNLNKLLKDSLAASKRREIKEKPKSRQPKEGSD